MARKTTLRMDDDGREIDVHHYEAFDIKPHGVRWYKCKVLLDRLECKGFVTRDRRAPVHIFAAAINRDELIGRRLRAVADSLCGGSLSPLLTHLVEGRGLSEQEPMLPLAAGYAATKAVVKGVWWALKGIEPLTSTK